MRRRIIKDFPDKLPPSTIFLDDLQAIEEFVRSSMDSNYTLIGFFYEVDEEFRVDSIGDLKSNGGHAKSLKMGIECCRALPEDGAPTEEFSLITMSVWGGADMSCPQCLGVNEREFYHELRKIFEPRKHPFLAAIESLPVNFRRFLISSIGSLAGLGAISICWFSGRYLYALHLSGWLSAVAFVVAIGLALIALVPALVTTPFLSPSSSLCQVNFHYMRERALEQQKSRKETIQKVILIVLSAALGVAGTILVQLFRSSPKH
jgi:hypothetical protein